MSLRFMMPLAVAAGAGMLFGIGIVFGLGLLAPPQKIEATGLSKYAQHTQGASKQVKRLDEQAPSPIYPASHGSPVEIEAVSAKAAIHLGKPQIEDDRALTPIFPASPGGPAATEAVSAKAGDQLGEPQVEKRAKPPAVAHRPARKKRALARVPRPAGIERTDPDPFIRLQLLRENLSGQR